MLLQQAQQYIRWRYTTAGRKRVQFITRKGGMAETAAAIHKFAGKHLSLIVHCYSSYCACSLWNGAWLWYVPWRCVIITGTVNLHAGVYTHAHTTLTAQAAWTSMGHRAQKPAALQLNGTRCAMQTCLEPPTASC